MRNVKTSSATLGRPIAGVLFVNVNKTFTHQSTSYITTEYFPWQLSEQMTSKHKSNTRNLLICYRLPLMGEFTRSQQRARCLGVEARTSTCLREPAGGRRRASAEHNKSISINCPGRRRRHAPLKHDNWPY